MKRVWTIVVDPQRDIPQYLAEAEQRSVQIRYVSPTHFDADFLAGHLELRDRCGAEIRLGAKASAAYALKPMAANPIYVPRSAGAHKS